MFGAPFNKRSILSSIVFDMICVSAALLIAHAFDMEREAHRFPIHLGKRKSREIAIGNLVANRARGILAVTSSFLENGEQARIELDVWWATTTRSTIELPPRVNNNVKGVIILLLCLCTLVGAQDLEIVSLFPVFSLSPDLWVIEWTSSQYEMYYIQMNTNSSLNNDTLILWDPYKV